MHLNAHREDFVGHIFWMPVDKKCILKTKQRAYNTTEGYKYSFSFLHLHLLSAAGDNFRKWEAGMANSSASSLKKNRMTTTFVS
jgi:hypothetical protein